MYCIQNSCICTPSPFFKALAGFTSVLAITVIALSIIGLTASPSVPFNAIVQFGKATNGILLGTSIFVLILDLVWISVLCKKTKERSVFQSEFSQSALVSAIEEINDTDSFSQLPEEIILRTFGFLSANELAKCEKISRRLRRLASDQVLWNAFDLRKFDPFLNVIDKSDWERHVDLSTFGLNLDNVPLLDKRKVIPALKRIASSQPRIKGKSGVTLLLIPEGLKIRTFFDIAKLPNVNVPQIRCIWTCISDQIGDIQVDKTYWIVITNNIFERSRNQSVSSQNDLLQKMGWEMPKTTEILGLITLTYMASEGQTCLYNYNPMTFTRCSEHVDGNQIVVGGLSPDGVFLHLNYFKNGFGFDIYGDAGVLRKF